MSRTPHFVAFVFGLFIAGCASAPPPTEHMAGSQASIRAAEEMGARKVPQAALYLQLANEQVIQAKELSKQGDNERARLVLMRASADAELALALAKESATRADAQKSVDEVHALQQGKM